MRCMPCYGFADANVLHIRPNFFMRVNESAYILTVFGGYLIYLFRNTLGVMPVIRLKKRVKVVCSSKPKSCAMSAIELSV